MIIVYVFINLTSKFNANYLPSSFGNKQHIHLGMYTHQLLVEYTMLTAYMPIPDNVIIRLETKGFIGHGTGIVSSMNIVCVAFD